MDRARAVSAETGPRVSFGEAFRVWLKIGLLSFGGPAGQIALMHRILVDEKNWMGVEASRMGLRPLIRSW